MMLTSLTEVHEVIPKLTLSQLAYVQITVQPWQNRHGLTAQILSTFLHSFYSRYRLYWPSFSYQHVNS